MANVGFQKAQKEVYKRKFSYKPFLILIILLFLAAVNYRSSSPNVIFEQNVVSADVNKVINETINKNKFVFLKTSNYISQTNLQKMLELNPYIDKVELRQSLVGFKWDILVKFKKPTIHYIYQSGEGYVDEDGVFLGNVYSSNKQDLINIEDLNLSYRPQLNQRVITESQLQLINQMNIKLSDPKMPKLKKIILPDKEPYEVVFETQDFAIRTSTENKAEQTVASLQAMIEQFQKDNTVPTEYLDLRILYKAYVK